MARGGEGWLGKDGPGRRGPRTTELPQCPLRVVVPVAAFGHMASLQLYGGLNVPQRFITGLQADAWEQSQAPGAWGIFNPFVPACTGETERKADGKAAPTATHTDRLQLLEKMA